MVKIYEEKEFLTARKERYDKQKEGCMKELKALVGYAGDDFHIGMAKPEEFTEQKKKAVRVVKQLGMEAEARVKRIEEKLAKFGGAGSATQEKTTQATGH